MLKKESKKPKWKPKTFYMGVRIDTKTGKTILINPVQAKTPEEEEKMEKEFGETYSRAMKILWGDNYYLITGAFKELIQKYGDNLEKEYKEALKELKEEEKKIKKEIPLSLLHLFIANKLYKRLKKKKSQK